LSTKPNDLVTEQTAPQANDRPAVWPLVVADMQARDAEGRRKYGVPLQPANNRNALVDAYQESLDQTVYLRSEIEVRRMEVAAFVALGFAFDREEDGRHICEFAALPGAMTYGATPILALAGCLAIVLRERQAAPAPTGPSPEAAAQDLLAACREARSVVLLAVWEGTRCLPGFDVNTHTTVKRLTDAIEKATGERPPPGPRYGCRLHMDCAKSPDGSLHCHWSDCEDGDNCEGHEPMGGEAHG
jgi:hypothetical protein